MTGALPAADRKAQPLPGALVIQALLAMDTEAKKRGEMFPQTADKQRESSDAVFNVIKSLEFYTSDRQSRDGWPSVKDWPALPPGEGAARILREIWLEGGGNTDIAEPTEQEVRDLVYGLNKLVNEYEEETTRKDNMKTTFQGHVTSVSNAAPVGKVAVVLQLPMEEADGKELTIFVPASDAAHWLPGRMATFTICAQPADGAAA